MRCNKIAGIIWPIQAIPEWLMYISEGLPLTIATDALRSVMGRGLYPAFFILRSGVKGGTKRSLPQLRSCVKVEVAVLGSPSLKVFMFSADVKQHCEKVEVAVLGSPSLTVLMVSKKKKEH